jgi:hypothetical protein
MAQASLGAMAKTWVLDTETKGAGAHMVPLEKILREREREPELNLPERHDRPWRSGGRLRRRYLWLVAIQSADARF